MDAVITIAELRSRLDRLDAGAVLKISERDYEGLFGVNEVAAARAAQVAGMHHCVSVPGADAVYFRKSSVGQCRSTGVVQGDAAR